MKITGAEIFAKYRVRIVLPESYCRRLTDGSGYIVWPRGVQPRGCEECAIGFGVTANKAWSDAEKNLALSKEQQ